MSRLAGVFCPERSALAQPPPLPNCPYPPPTTHCLLPTTNPLTTRSLSIRMMEDLHHERRVSRGRHSGARGVPNRLLGMMGP